MAEAVARKRNPKKPDLQKTLTQVTKAGLTVERVEIDRHGKQVIYMAGAKPAEVAPLDQWIADNARQA